MDIKDDILQSVVIHYIREESPIGSKQLQQDFELLVSTATIRNYYKKLVDEGLLVKVHSSSGKIPTYDALVNYWTTTLPSCQELNITDEKNLFKIANYYELFVCLKNNSSKYLKK